MLPKNFNEPMAPAIFEKQIKIKLLHPASILKSRIQVIDDCSTAPTEYLSIRYGWFR
ncbi:MAG: hypothetical protein P8X74_08730 [Reinekea sp.]